MPSSSFPQVVVVTGASAGVGRATARAFAGEGAAVGLIARGRERLEAAKAELEQLGVRAAFVQADVADAAKVDAAAEQLERELGPIDVWVNKRNGDGVRAGRRHDAGRVPSRHRGHLPRLGLGDAGR